MPRAYDITQSSLDAQNLEVRLRLQSAGASGLFVSQRHLRSKSALYVIESPFGLPSRETARPQDTLQRRRIGADCFGFSREERVCIPEATPSYLAIRIKKYHRSQHQILYSRRGRRNATHNQANALGFSRSERPTRLSISDRIRSSTPKLTFAPSSVGSMCTRNGRLPNGVFTTSTMAAATAEGSA
jgi:hypothetical protein